MVRTREEFHVDTKLNTWILGGGYGIGAFDGHAIFLAQCAERLAATGQDAVIAFLEYGKPLDIYQFRALTPVDPGLTKESKYPTQMKQATESLRYLIEEGYKPSDVR